MRITSLLMASLVAFGLFLWFGGASRLGLVDPAPEGIAGADATPEAAPAAAPVAAAAAESPAPAPAPAPEATPDDAAAPVPVIVMTSTAVAHVGEVVLRGRTEAQRRVEVAAETTGLVVSEPLRRGAVVAAGDVLCRLDPGTREAELSEAEARLAEAEAEYAAASRLSDRGFGSETKEISMRAMRQSAEAGVRRVTLDMERLTIRAPFAGILDTDAAELGAYLTPGAHCATIIDLDPITVTGYISETEVGWLAEGQGASVRLLDGSVRGGTVRFISRSADPETRTFRVDVSLANPDGAIRDGLTAEIRIALPPVAAHFLPQSALTLDDDGRLGVRAAEAGLAAFHPVTILAEDQDGIWLAGLPDTLEVIVRGQEFVRAGSPVAPIPLEGAAIR